MKKSIKRTSCFFLFLLAIWLTPAFIQNAEAQYNSVDFATFANNFSCTNLGEPLNRLFDNGMGRCDPQGTENLFTNAVCTYEDIIDELLGKLFCGMQHDFQPILSAAIILMVVVFGAAFALGILPLTAREAVGTLFKLALVYYFATDSYPTINLLYTGLMNFIQDSVRAVMANSSFEVTSLSHAGGLFDKMDDIIADFVNRAATSQDPADPCKNGLASMVLTFIGTVPMLAILGISMAFQLVMVFFQMILGYFIAMTGIMFLCATSPIFLSLALFKFTRGYFDKWATYLLAFAVQIFVVAAFISMLISLGLGEQLRSLFDLTRSYTVSQQAEGVRIPFRDWCSICEPIEDPDKENRPFAVQCKDGPKAEAVPPYAMLSNPQTVSIFGGRLLKIMVLAYILRAIMNAVPGVARALASPNTYAPAVAGVDVFFPGSSISNFGANSFRGGGGGAATRRSGFDFLSGGRTKP